jgi:hypothetical protein
VANTNIFGAVREILQANGNAPIRASEVAARLRSQGFSNMNPQAVRAVLGAHIAALGDRTWRVTDAVLAQLGALDGDQYGESSDHVAESARQSMVRGAGPGINGPEALTPDGSNPAEPSLVAVPAGLPVAVRIALRDGPAPIESLQGRLAAMGWTGVGLDLLKTCLVASPHLFVATELVWGLAPGGERARIDPLPPKRVLLEPEGDEWQLKGLPPEPEMRHLFLEIYRAARVRETPTGLNVRRPK